MELATPAAEIAPKKPASKTAKLPKSKELDTRGLHVAQADPFVMPPIHEPIEHPDVHIEVTERALQKAQADALAFAEEPITIQIHPGREKFAPKFQEGWVNGKGIEILLNGRWIETKGVPVGHKVTIKRKYVEVLARSFTDTITTKIVHPENPEEDVQNRVERATSHNVPFSVLHDPNPKGQEWLTRLMGFAN